MILMLLPYCIISIPQAISQSSKFIRNSWKTALRSTQSFPIKGVGLKSTLQTLTDRYMTQSIKQPSATSPTSNIVSAEPNLSELSKKAAATASSVMTREELMKKLSSNPRFKLASKRGQGYIVVG